MPGAFWGQTAFYPQAGKASARSWVYGNRETVLA